MLKGSKALWPLAIRTNKNMRNIHPPSEKYCFYQIQIIKFKANMYCYGPITTPKT